MKGNIIYLELVGLGVSVFLGSQYGSTLPTAIIITFISILSGVSVIVTTHFIRRLRKIPAIIDKVRERVYILSIVLIVIGMFTYNFKIGLISIGIPSVFALYGGFTALFMKK